MRPTRTLIASIACATLLLLAPLATAAPTDDQTPIQAEIQAREATALPEFSSALIELYFDTIRQYASGDALHEERSLHEPTVMNAIALSRASGVPMTAAELGDASFARSRTAQSALLPIPDAAQIQNVLTLGVPPVRGFVTDLPYAVVNTEDESGTRTNRIRDDNALSGIALASSGIALDPRVLVESVTTTRENDASAAATLSSIPGAGAALTTKDVLAAGAVFRFGAPFPGELIASLDLSHTDHVDSMRAVDLPEDRALAAIAASRSGIPVNADDLLDTLDTRHEAVAEDRAVTYSLRDVLSVLTLGFVPA